MGTDSRLTERVLRAPTRVVLLTGPAACGKTAAAVGVYRHFIDEQARARCLLIAPNAAAAGALRGILTTGAGGALVGPRVLTFAAVAERILAEADRPVRAVSGLGRQLLLQRIVDELAAARRLPALGAVADTPGLIAALDRSIAELKRAAIDPEVLARAVGKGPGKAADLLEVYRQYQQALRAGGLYDVEGRMWEARDALAAAGDSGPLPLPEGVRAIAVDGFTDFTPTQLEILRLCSRRIERVLITLPYVEDQRRRLWHWTARTLDNIRKAFGADLTELTAQRSRAAPLADLWDRLFDPDAPPCPRPAELSLVAAPDIEAEVGEAARRIKRLLAGGCPPGQIALCARSMEGYRPAIERIFRAADIPVASAPAALTDEPIVRFLLDAAALGPEFAFRDVLRVVKNSYFRPGALGPYDATTVAAAELIVREGNVLTGRQAYAHAAIRLANARRRREEDDEFGAAGLAALPSEALPAAAAMLEALFDAATRAADPPGLLALAATLQLHQAACAGDCPERIARDLRALSALKDSLAPLSVPYPTMSRLQEALGSVTAPGEAAWSPVHVTDVLDLRALRFRHVFVLGLGEGHFPPRFSDSAVLGESQRAAWAARGVALDCRTDLATREMLLFYLAVSRADESLTLSYLEPEGGGLGAGGFLEALLDPLGGPPAFAPERIAPGTPVPAGADGTIDPARIVSPAEALLAATAGLFSRDLTGGQPALAWAVQNAPGPIARAAMGIFARHRRWLPGPADRFDGRLDAPPLLAALAESFGPDRVFSASGLNMMATCPWHFFARYVLNLEPLIEPERQLEAQGRGLFVHAVLCQTFRTLAGQAPSVSLDQVEPARCTAALEQAVAEQAALVEARRPPYPALWAIQLEQMRAELNVFLQAQREHPLAPESLRFELAFGLEGPAGDNADPHSSPDPVTVDTPAGPVRLHGRIDRVDRVAACGLSGLFVVDYKTGQLPSPADIQDGRNLQLLLYAEAASQLLDEPALGGAFSQVGKKPAHRYFAAVEVARGKVAAREGFDTTRQDLLTLTGGLVERIRQGRFDLPAREVCTSWCPYRRVCQFSQARAAVKEAPDAQ